MIGSDRQQKPLARACDRASGFVGSYSKCAAKHYG